jgi:hypothetical protein
MGHSTTRASVIYQHRTSLRESAGEPKPSAPIARNGHEATVNRGAEHDHERKVFYTHTFLS